MNNNQARTIATIVFVLSVLLSACGGLATEAPTGTPQPTATKTLVPTATSTPTRTPRPTRTPNPTPTDWVDAYEVELQTYIDLGYLPSAEGRFVRYEGLNRAWAQLGWYQRWTQDDVARNFFMSAHFKWSSAYRNADESGCGFVFATQENDDHYAVFLDWRRVTFIVYDSASYYARRVGLTRGTGSVKFDNPADQPAEADFTLIVNDAYAYVLVNGEVVGEYTLSQSKILKGKLGITMISGTNKDYGTRCEMTIVHAFILND